MVTVEAVVGVSAEAVFMVDIWEEVVEVQRRRPTSKRVAHGQDHTFMLARKRRSMPPMGAPKFASQYQKKKATKLRI
jgi:hypothetical protein